MNDLYEALIESATPVVRSAPEGVELWRACASALREAGAAFIGGGLHPNAALRRRRARPTARYEAIRDEMRGLRRAHADRARCTSTSGCRTPRPRSRVCNRLRAHLPLLQALAAHSPFWHGHDSGLASARAQLFRGFPRSTIPPAFAGWDDYARLVALVREPPARCPTTRSCGGTSGRARSSARSRCARWTRSRGWTSVAGLAALIHALAVACADGHDDVDAAAEALMESSFRAARDGVDATIWWRGALRPMREVGADALALARPYARDLDGEDALEEIERILREGGGADRMRARPRRRRDAGGARALASPTSLYGSTQTTSPIRSQS